MQYLINKEIIHIKYKNNNGNMANTAIHKIIREIIREINNVYTNNNINNKDEIIANYETLIESHIPLLKEREHQYLSDINRRYANFKTKEIKRPIFYFLISAVNSPFPFLLPPFSRNMIQNDITFLNRQNS